eukprot:Hpha_TRINITY_DN15927_c7_g5::TRINITY_DN15927_c7_g5_i1::g.74264::m.74264
MTPFIPPWGVQWFDTGAYGLQTLPPLYPVPTPSTFASVQMDGGCPIVPVGQTQYHAEARGGRRRRRGGKSVRAREGGVETRVDPTDGRRRTWVGFMMEHAQGASFEEADRLWALAAPSPRPMQPPMSPPSDVGCGEGCADTGLKQEPKDDDDTPPPLIDPGTPSELPVPPGRRVRFHHQHDVVVTSHYEDGTETHEKGEEGLDFPGENCKTAGGTGAGPPTSILKQCSRLQTTTG